MKDDTQKQNKKAATGSYLSITAVTAVGSEDNTEKASHAIAEALQHEAISPVRLEAQMGARMVMYNQTILKLKEERQFLVEKLDSLVLALHELKNLSPEDGVGELSPQKKAIVHTLSQEINDIKKALLEVGHKISLLKDFQEDQQKKIYREFEVVLKKLEEVNQEKVSIIFEFLKKKNIDIKNKDLVETLLSALNASKNQISFMAKTPSSSLKGFTQKLKDWFK